MKREIPTHTHTHTFHKELSCARDAASIICDHTSIISTVAQLHVVQLQLCHRLIQRNGAGAVWHQLPDASEPGDFEGGASLDVAGECHT